MPPFEVLIADTICAAVKVVGVFVGVSAKVTVCAVPLPTWTVKETPVPVSVKPGVAPVARPVPVRVAACPVGNVFDGFEKLMTVPSTVMVSLLWKPAESESAAVPDNAVAPVIGAGATAATTGGPAEAGTP